MVVAEQFGGACFDAAGFLHSPLQVMTLDLFEMLDEIEFVTKRVSEGIRACRAGDIGQRGGLDQSPVAKNGRLQQSVIKLADVSRPGIPLEKCGCTF
jgi:hypothetical protein